VLRAYADEHVHAAIVQALRARGMDVVTVQDRGREGTDDAELLAEALRDGAVVIRPICVLCATFDHRIMDGLMAGKLAKFVGRYLGNPQEYESS